MSTAIGEFNATDPDGHAITYHFVNGENNNSLFTLDTNGTLKTATTFDYESNASSYIITVQAKDELNATTEGNFTVTLLDVYEDTDGDGLTDTEETNGYSSYQLIEGNFTWEQAKVDAESRGGQLAVIRNSADNLHIQKLIEFGDEAWIGAKDPDNEGSYTWITNEPWQFDGRDGNVSNRPKNYFNFDDFPPELNDFELSGVASYLTDSTLALFKS